MARQAARAETETWEQRVTKLAKGKGKMRWIGQNGRLLQTLTLSTAYKKEGPELLLEKTWEEGTWATTLSKVVGTEGE